ncbi:unnamed protein product [Didymodactylos carnosus]|uniref:Dishevelled n=1 Tax=Didymodactylos carnosus TaxID=1234261 RepID=A0A8S2RNE6_9BILA|nr:unnamed protein product [Didymodactylos carnosus]CAF4176775.1 unnamed protein product [Didymodactylos carnosus]
MASDNTIGKVKEEIINDDQILPYADNSTDRILAYLVSIEGSTTSGGDRSSTASGGKHQYKQQRIIDDDTLTTTMNNSSFIQQPRLQRNSRRYHSEDDRYSTITDSTTVSCRYHGRDRQRRRKHRLPAAIDRASSFSSLNSDSTMTLNIITVTLNLDSVNFLGISIVGQSDKNGMSDGGIYVGSTMKGGAVVHDGRIEPGDMILQVNDISFEKLSNDDAARPVDPLSWLAHNQAVTNTFNPQVRQSLQHHNSTTNMNSTISPGSNTLADNERFALDLNLTGNSDMDTILRAMTEKDSGLDIRDRSDLVNWLYEHVEGFIQRNDARKYASSMLKAGDIRHTVNKLTFSEQCYYVFGDLYTQGDSSCSKDALSVKSSSTSSTTSDIDSLKLSSKQKQQKQQQHHHHNSTLNNSRQLESVPNQLRSSKESFLQAMAHPCKLFVDVMQLTHLIDVMHIPRK